MIQIILASGMGTRTGKKIPKCLIKYKNETLLSRILKNSRFFKKTIIITGYKSKLILKELKKYKINDIKVVLNKDFKKTNMVDSFFKSYKFLNSDIVITYSDIIYDSEIIEKTVKYTDNILPLKENWLDVWKKRMDYNLIKKDAENIKTFKNNILEIGTKIKNKMPKYQFMGIIKIKNKSINPIFKFYKNLNNPNIDFTNFLNLVINKNITKFKFFSTKKFWYEIDTAEDLKFLKN